jgi:hypothetical protein
MVLEIVVALVAFLIGWSAASQRHKPSSPCSELRATAYRDIFGTVYDYRRSLSDAVTFTDEVDKAKWASVWEAQRQLDRALYKYSFLLTNDFECAVRRVLDAKVQPPEVAVALDSIEREWMTMMHSARKDAVLPQGA